MRALAIAVVLAGCGGKPAPVPPAPDNTAPDAPAPVYAALFVDGASWTFDVEQTDSDYDEHDQMVDDVQHFVLGCHVESVERDGDAVTSEIVCDDAWPTAGGSVPLPGTWVMTPRGLWQGVAEGAPMIANPPVAWETSEPDPGMDRAANETMVEPQGDAWCWSYQNYQGDSYWTRLCIGPDGFTEGSYGWSGGSEHSTSFTRAK